MAEAIDTHLSRIYAREVKRVGDDRLMRWWSDVDGCGTSIDQWMAETVAPLLLTLGQLDLAFDHPAAPEDEEVETSADAERLGLDHCFASYILPENMLWWRLDPTGHRYAECLVREYHEGLEGSVERYRYWTADESTLYDADGTVLSVTHHPFGRVPIVRVFDRRKPRCKNIGQPRYEGVAERQREYYNRDSELILSDTTQAHPLSARARGLRPGRRHDPDRPELAPAQEEEHPGRCDHVRGFRRRRLPQGWRRVDSQEQSRPSRRRRP